jgi:hypothetical protein
MNPGTAPHASPSPPMPALRLLERPQAPPHVHAPALSWGLRVGRWIDRLMAR